MIKDATRFTNVFADSVETAAQTVASATITALTATNLNGKKAKGILVIASLAADKTLNATEKANEIIEVTVSDADKTLTLGMAAGERMVIKNNDSTNALKVKNVAADTALTIPASGSAIVFAGTAGAMIYFMDTTV